MRFETIYGFGDIVYIKTDPDQLKRMVTEILFTPSGHNYKICTGPSYSWHYEIELSDEKDIMMTTNN